MAKRAPPVRRIVSPLRPHAAVLVVVGSAVEVRVPESVEIRTVGRKAFGLASIPPAWTKPFFVIDGATKPELAALEEALRRSGLDKAHRLIVRSSGVDEGLGARGALDSGECVPSGLAAEIDRLVARTQAGASVHWVVQEAIEQRAKGHLSNERRVAKDKRDWVVEFEASASYGAETHRIPLRRWRDNRRPAEDLLCCGHREIVVDRLRTVAGWTYDRVIRVHFEWVWDGRAVHIVQADPCDEVVQGIDPHSSVRKAAGFDAAGIGLTSFRVASAADYRKYKKLANVKLYGELGYTTPPFYVFDSPDEVRGIAEGKQISSAVQADLRTLTQVGLVIRTDGTNIPGHLREMLPRSDELRSSEAAEQWLRDTFSKKATAANEEGERLLDYELCLIAHHFVPAVASAWCQALPDQRRVRIESLWGIPEGLYWYAYDVYDVDTTAASIAKMNRRPKAFSIRIRQRYKEHFVAPDSNGSWIVQKTSEKADWARSIARTEWIHEVAWTTRCIASAENKPVVVMWLIDTAVASTPHRVLPWYHQEWKHEGRLYKASPRKKFDKSSEVVVRSHAEWAQIRAAIDRGETLARIKVDPREPELVRDQAFVQELAAVSKQHGNVVELSGGILSHAYYMLTRAGCDVECADLDDFAVEDEAIEYNKLVRDEIPRVIAERGESVGVMKLQGEALVAALRRKLVEESLEVLDAKTVDQIAEELADVREVISSLMTELEINDARVETARREKAKARGGFNRGLMLGRTAMSASVAASQTGESPLIIGGDVAEKTLSSVAELPTNAPDDLHVDQRRDSEGAAERQLTAVVPVHAAGFVPPRVSFNLQTPDQRDHEMVCEVQLDRKGAELRIRIRLINPPHQLPLDLPKPEQR